MKPTILSGLILLFTFLFNAQLIAQEDQETSKDDGVVSITWKDGDSTRHYDFDCDWDDIHDHGFPFCHKKKKYNGHWAGVDWGMGGYANADFRMDFKGTPWLNMNLARSMMVNINPFELNVNLYNQKLGFTTGLGFQTSNYFFTGNYILLSDSLNLVAYRVQDQNGYPVELEKNKLVVSYLNLPLLFEFQTNPNRRTNSFHFTLGVIGGARIGSYTKQVYYQPSGNYYLVDEDGNPVASYGIDNHKVRNRASYHLNAFKLDAAVRIGWSHLNLFGTYSLTQLFHKGTAPEVYPFTFGITMIGW